MQRMTKDWQMENEQEEATVLDPSCAEYINQLDVLTEYRMKMLNKLFSQMNIDTKPIRRSYST